MIRGPFEILVQGTPFFLLELSSLSYGTSRNLHSIRMVGPLMWWWWWWWWWWWCFPPGN